MSGLFGTLNVGNKGMQAAQTALHTTGHNISNANTEGYSRQRVDLKADLATTLGGVGQLGSGVKMNGIARLVDDYVARQIRGENATLSKFGAKSEVLEQLEIIYNEPSDTSLNFNLGEMFDSWTELSKNPELLTAKSIVVEKSKTMADTLNHIANQLDGLKTNTTDLIDMNAKNFNEIVKSLDTLNSQIYNISIKGQVPNDLLDQRDLLMKDISSITDFTSTFDKFGRVEIKVAGADVLTANGVQLEMKASEDGSVTLEGASLATPLTLALSKGEIAGYQDALVEIDAQIAQLDKFAGSLAKAINDAHNDAANGGSGTPKMDFFTDDGNASADYTKITAANLKVNQAILSDNNKVNAGTGSNPADGDGSRALAVANVRNIKQPDISNTIEGAYNSMITNVGISKQQADNMVANQGVLLDQLVLRRESTSGVNIDEEVTNMIKFQKSFEANARVIQTLSDMLDVLINRTGV